MFKKSLASVVSAAIIVAGPGHLSINAAAQSIARPVTSISVTPTIGTGMNAPVPSAASFNMPTLSPSASLTPSLIAAPSVTPAPVAAVPVAAVAVAQPVAQPAAVAKSFPAGSYAALRAMQLPPASRGESANAVVAKAAALNTMFDASASRPESLEVLGQSAASVESGLGRSEVVSAQTPAAIEAARVEKGQAAGEAAIVNLIKRAWNAVLGALGIGVKKLETPEVMAQRIIDQLNAQKPVYNRKVQEASTLVEKLKLQVEGETKKVAELERGITALLSDSDPTNDIMASGMINQQKTLNASIASTNEQIVLSEATLVSIKEERARFFSEREEMLAKIQSGLTKSKSAEIQKQIAELKGGFQVGDLKDNMDRFEDAVNDKVADAKGTVDSVESNPDQILKKAKDSLKSQEVQDEIAKRKAAIEAAKKDKGQAGGGVISTLKAASIGLNVAMAAWAGLNTGWIAMFLAASAVTGIVMPLGGIGAIVGGVFAEKVLKTSGAKTAGAALLGGVIGFGLGLVAVGVAGYVGFAVASPVAAVVLGVIALLTSLSGLAFKAIFKKDAKSAVKNDDKGQAGGSAEGAATVTMVLASAAMLFGAGPLITWAAASGVTIQVLLVGSIMSGLLPLLAAGAVEAAWNRLSPQDEKGKSGGLVLELGIGAAIVAVVALISAPFRNLLARAWNAALGVLGIGVKKLETPEVMAQRIIDQLNAQKPVYNRKVQEASTLVEKLRLQIEKQEAQSKELDRSVTAILSDSDPLNDVMAESLLNQKKTVDASTAMTKEQLTISESTLASIKEERASFFSEREEMLAKIQAGLTKSKSAEIQKQIAELKGGFQVGDLKDNMDRFEDAVNDKVADAKGTVDSVESNPDQILKKAKDSLKNQEVQDEIAKRKAAIEAAKKDKGQAGGAVTGFQLAGGVIGAAITLMSPVTALVIAATLGILTLVDDMATTRSGKYFSNLGKSSKFYAFSIGAALGTLGLWLAGTSTLLLFAGIGATVLSNALGHVHKAIYNAKLRASDKGRSGGLVLELGIGAAIVAVVALISAPFRNLLARAWNAALGALGIGVKKLETPEVMAQRIIDQLNAQKPVYNRKVQEASTLVEKLRLQIEKQEAQSKELDRSVTAILSDSDPLNDVMAESLLNQKKTVDASTVMTKEQLTISESTLASIKEERASFFSEREEMLAKIQAGLTKSKSAEIQKQIAELKGGFEIGDLKDNMDRFEDAVNDKVADAKGTVDSVESNPDQILKKAKDSLKNQEVQDEIAKRKAAIEAARKDKGQAGGDASQSKALGLFAKAIGIGFALISPWISSAVFALLGLVAIAMAPEQGRWFGRQLAVIGIGTLVIGGGATLLAAKFGLAVGAFGVGMSFIVPAGIALAAGIIAAVRAHSKANGAVAAAAATPAGSSVMTPAPAAAPVAEPSAPQASSPKVSFSIKPLLNLLARAWNALLGLFGMGVKKMETPEIMAQRLIDQLNDAKPVYNNKVREASTLVEKLRQQIAGEEAKIAEFEKTITAILSDNNPANDIQAAGLLNSQKTLQASVASSKEQLASSEKALENIKEERARFFSEREETLAKIQAGLTKVKSAEIQKQIAELKGGFQIGDLKDNIDRFDSAVNDKIADAKGATDAVDSNPDEILKKAKGSLRSQEVADELAKRKAAIEAAKKAKGQAGGAVEGDQPLTAAQAEQGILAKTYSWMTLGLGITAAAAQAAIVTGIATTVLASLPMMIGLVVLQLALVIGLSLSIRKLSPGAALTGFLAYSAVNGLFLAPLVAMFTVGSVAGAFVVTAGMFGVMAVLGHTIKANLNSVGSYGMMALTGVILASIVNMFLHSTGLGAILTYATILIFVGLTAYDAQKIKEMAQQQGRLSKDDQSRIAVMGALTLYLDFINLFIQILKIMGKAKSNK